MTLFHFYEAVANCTDDGGTWMHFSLSCLDFYEEQRTVLMTGLGLKRPQNKTTHYRQFRERDPLTASMTCLQKVPAEFFPDYPSDY
jgi:hypothetical protein